MTYHELETFNGDSSSVVVHEPYFALSNLQPGRNYSISIQAVANGIESVDRSIFQATSEYPLSFLLLAEVQPMALMSSVNLYNSSGNCQLGGKVRQENLAMQLSQETGLVFPGQGYSRLG